ncbi:uncharacterized protein METZ01_LOCUS239407, partial [marine metagenome]
VVFGCVVVVPAVVVGWVVVASDALFVATVVVPAVVVGWVVVASDALF